MRLRKEVSVVIVLKVMFIWGLWYICFSHPVKDQLTSARLGQHFFHTNNISNLRGEHGF